MNQIVFNEICSGSIHMPCIGFVCGALFDVWPNQYRFCKTKKDTLLLSTTKICIQFHIENKQNNGKCNQMVSLLPLKFILINLPNGHKTNLHFEIIP